MTDKPLRIPPKFLCNCDMTRRYRTWRLIIWPDSAPENWLDLLQSFCVPFALSCLHTSDPEAVLDDERKPHYHAVFFFDGMKSFYQMDLIALAVNAPMPLPADSPRGAVRYFCHLDHPEKPQYAISTVQCFCGAEVRQYFELSFYQEVYSSKELFRYIKENHISEYRDLVDDLSEKGLDEWYIMATKTMTIAIKAYISSSRYSK